MDCYFHDNVPSVAPCNDCGKAICATCRDTNGTCPSCRLEAKMASAQGVRQTLTGQVPPKRNAYVPPQPPPQAAVTRATVDVSDATETRCLVSLGYPLFPLALIALLDRKSSRWLRKQAFQAVGFNLGIGALWALLQYMTMIPLPNIAFPSGITLAFLLPFYFIASVFCGIKVWQGQDVRLPLISDWVDWFDDRLPARQHTA